MDHALGVVRILIDSFLPHRGLALAPRGLARDGVIRAFGEDEIILDMEQFGYVRLDALRAAPRGGRDWVVVLVLAPGGKYSLYSPDLRKLLDGVESSDRAAKEDRLDELIVVADEPFFEKKNLTDVIRDLRERQVGGRDEAGATPFYSAHPFYIFATVLPKVTSVYPHRVMSEAELAALLARERKDLRDLPVIYADDPPIIWNGGREGQVVEITRDSQINGVQVSYRRIERRAL